MNAQTVTKTSDSDVLLFNSLVELIRHTDDQITKANEYYVAALGAVIAVATVLDHVTLGWPAYVGVLLLAISLALRWFSLTTKLGKDKLCWTVRARDLENALFPERVGPFTAQMKFFRASARTELGVTENWLLSFVGPAMVRRLSTLLLAVGLAVVVVGLSLSIRSRQSQSSSPAKQALQQQAGRTKGDHLERRPPRLPTI